MLTKLTVLFALIVFATLVNSQTPCSKIISESPSILGLRLGMPIGELSNVIGPTIKFKAAKNGEGSFFQNFVEQQPPQNLAGTRALYVRYFSGKVYQIEVFFEDKDQSNKVEDFTKQLSADYELPLGAWTIKNNRAKLNCDGFSLTADAILNRHIEITDDAAYTEFQMKTEREKATKRKQRQSVTPVVYDRSDVPRPSAKLYQSDGAVDSSNSSVSPLGRI